MVQVRFLSLDGLSLERKYQCSKYEYNGRIYYIEQTKNRTETISTRNTTLVDVFGTIVSTKTIKQFADQNNGCQTGDRFIFPSLNLIVSISQDQEEFSEILIYSSELRSLYETDCLVASPKNFETAKRVRIVPYKSVGDFILGDSSHSVQNRLGLPVENHLLKSVIRANSFFLSFYNGTLGQVNLVPDQDAELQIGDTLILVKNSIRLLTKTEEVIHRISHYVFPNLGIALHKNLDEIVGFDERILKYWQNVHRPISSW